MKFKEKKDWVKQFKNNTAVTDVVWGVVNINGEQRLTWVGLTPSTKPFCDFMNKIQDTIFTNGCTNFPNHQYDEIVEYAYQNSEYKVYKAYLKTSDFISIREDYGNVYFVPYSDGVMLYGINIKPELRGNGIGTDIMNKLYDISEEMNIPIYLIPYPDDNFPSQDEKKLVDRLKNYYSRIGFGPISDDSLVWCNFE